jgi:mRNA interferase RelE/StbE
VKRLTNHFPEYHMRSGDYRALFEVDGDEVIVYRILHRRKSGFHGLLELTDKLRS